MTTITHPIERPSPAATAGYYYYVDSNDVVHPIRDATWEAVLDAMTEESPPTF